MKTTFISILALVICGFASSDRRDKAVSIMGAWQAQQSTMICTDRYFSIAEYDVPGKKFIGTYGGSYRLEGNRYIAIIEFNTFNPETVGSEVSGTFDLKKGMLVVDNDGTKTEWKQLDDGKPGKLAGAWLITGRMQNDKLSKMTPGARRTMKILSGTRFQWIAYNVETKQFSGTGGGTYTTKDGKYVENIEFFSRDNSRVGASLSFDFSLENGAWRHKGLSSKGDPIDEVWTKREMIGL